MHGEPSICPMTFAFHALRLPQTASPASYALSALSRASHAPARCLESALSRRYRSLKIQSYLCYVNSPIAPKLDVVNTTPKLEFRKASSQFMSEVSSNFALLTDLHQFPKVKLQIAGGANSRSPVHRSICSSILKNWY